MAVFEFLLIVSLRFL